MFGQSVKMLPRPSFNNFSLYLTSKISYIKSLLNLMRKVKYDRGINDSGVYVANNLGY